MSDYPAHVLFGMPRNRCSGSIGMAVRDGKEPFVRKGFAGMGFQVLFKFCGFVTGAECDNGFNFPWSIFGCMRNLPAIMGFKPGFYIFSKTGLVAGFVIFTD